MPAPRLLLIASAAAALTLPAAADAATYCVEKPACSGLDMTLDGALAEAASTAANDRIEIGEVTFPAASHGYAPAVDAGDLELVGSGRTKTVFQNKPGIEAPALSVLRGPGGNALRVAGLGIRVTAHANVVAVGLETGAVVDDVSVTSPAPSAGLALGIELTADAVLRDSTVAIQSTVKEANGRAAVYASGPGVLVERSTVDGVRAVVTEGATRVTRSRLHARGGTALSACRSLVRIDNSLVRVWDGGTGLSAQSSCPGGNVSRLEARQVTLRGDGSAGSTAVNCQANVDTAASVLLRGTIVDGTDRVAQMHSASADSSCTVEAGNSRVDLTDVVKAGNGPSSTQGLGGNTTVSPGFRNAALGDFRLKEGSSMLDVGPAGAVDPLAEATVDLPGNPRVVAASGFGTPRRDMGAYELQSDELGLAPAPQPEPLPEPPAPAPAPQPAPAPGTTPAPASGTTPAPAPGSLTPAPAADKRAPGLTKLALRSGKRAVKALRRAQRAGALLRVDLDETSTVTATVQRKVGRRWVRRASVTKKLVAGRRTLVLKPALRTARAGSYRVRVTATDAAGNRSVVRTLAFRVR